MAVNEATPDTVAEMPFRLVTEFCGELAAANVTVQRGVKPPSLAPAALGEPVAKLIHLPPGRVAAAPPSIQSNTSFSPKSVSGITAPSREQASPVAAVHIQQGMLLDAQPR